MVNAGQTGRGVLVGALFAVGAILVGGEIAPAQAATGAHAPRKAHAAQLRIVSPSQRLTTGRQLTVRVRVPQGARMRATVNAADVTGRFGKRRNGVRVARLRVGGALRSGMNTISVHARRGRHRWFASRTVVMATHERRAAGVGSGASRNVFSAFAGVRLLVPIARQALGAAPNRTTHVLARLNGRGVGYAFQTRFGTLGSGRLGVDEGLHFGRNRLTITAYTDSGRFSRQTHTFRVTRRAPLLATPRNRTVTVGRRLMVSARGSRPARRGDRLRFRWRIVVRPKGSKARLRKASSARPRLVPDVRGRYVLRLHVIEPGRKRARARSTTAKAAAAGASAPTQLLPSPSKALSATTSMQVLVPTLAPPLGFPVSTISAQGIQVGSQVYPGDSSAWAQVVVLNRATLEPVDAPNLSLPGNIHVGTGNYVFDQGSNPTQAKQFRELVNASDSGINASELVLITGGGHALSIDKAQWQALSYAFGKLGGTMRTFANNGTGSHDPGFGGGAWSLIGIPGLSQGTAAQNDGLAPASGQPSGSLIGRLMQDSSNNYSFVAGDYEPFDTNATGQSGHSGGVNQINVDKSTYGSQPLPSGQSGFQVLVLDAGTLAPLTNQTFATNVPDGQDVDNVKAMTALLEHYAHIGGRGTVIVVQSIGAPTPLNSAWTGPLAGAIAAIGGSSDVFNDLSGSTSRWGYSLVGGSGLDDDQSVQEAFNPENPQLQTPPARLRGLFTRNDQYQFYPSDTSPFQSPGVDGFDLSALPLAFAPGTHDWPLDSTAPDRAAEAYVARQVFYPDRQTGYDIHTYYWEADWLHSSSTYASALDNVCPPDGSPTAPKGAAFNNAVLGAVCTELHKEFVWVQALWGMDGAFQGAFIQQEISGPSNASQVADHVVDELKKQQASGNSEILADILLVEGTLTEVASEVIFATAGEETPGRAEIVASLGVMSGFLDMGSDLANSPSGQPDLSAYDTEAKNIGYAIVNQYKASIDASNKLVELLVSDYAKLSTAGPKAQDPQTWGLGQLDLNALSDSLRLSTSRYIWSKLLPVGYKVFRLGAGGDQWLQQGHGRWTPTTYRCYNNLGGSPGGPSIRPWRGTPASAWVNQTVGIVHGHDPYRQPVLLGSAKTHFAQSGFGDNHVIFAYPGAPPPSSFTNTLFSPVQSAQFDSGTTPLTQLGENPPVLFSPEGPFKQVQVGC